MAKRMNKAMIEENKRLAKKANRRMSLQEDNERYERGYQKAQQFLGEKSRFYTGENYTSQREIRKANTALKKYLSTETTTKTGYENALKNGVFDRQNNRIKYYDFDMASSLSYDDKLALYQKGAKTANKRMDLLENNEHTKFAYSKAETFTKSAFNKDRFYTGKLFESEQKLDRAIQHLYEFLNSRSSTLSGIKAIDRQRVASIIDNDNGVEIEQKDSDKLYDFLQEKQFKALVKYGDSATVMEDFVLALKEGFSKEEIMKDFEKWTSEEKTIDELEEKWKIERYKIVK